MDFKRKDFLEDIYLGVIYLKWTYTEHLTREHLYIFFKYIRNLCKYTVSILCHKTRLKTYFKMLFLKTIRSGIISTVR